MRMKKNKLECRIRYVEDWRGNGEHYLFENKWTNETEWGLDTAFKLLDYGEEKGVVMSYQVLIKIRNMKKLGIEFYFC